MRQVKASKTKLDVSEQIFDATDRLMAKEGLHHLSMHKLAKEAGIAVGTIYLYFKSKDELLAQFARRVFNKFVMVIEEGFDENQPFFEQYRKMWWNIWHSLEQDPTIVANMGQYEFLPGFYAICKEWETRGICHRFCKKAVEAGEVCDLPPHLLFALSLQSALNIAFKCKHFAHKSSMAMLESVIDRTWRAIQK